MGTRIIYVGPHDEMTIEVPGEPIFDVVRGEPIEVPERLAVGDPDRGRGGLLDQPDNWELAPDPAPTAKRARAHEEE